MGKIALAKAVISATAARWLFSIWCTVSVTNEMRMLKIAQSSSSTGRQQSSSLKSEEKDNTLSSCTDEHAVLRDTHQRSVRVI